MGPSGGSVKNSLTSSSATVQVSDREISGFEHVAIFSRPARSVNSLHLFSYQIISQDKFFPAGQPTAGLRPSPRAAPAGTFPVGTMSLLGTSTSLRSVTGCRVAESEVPPITTNPVSPGRRRWHGISRASATTSSPQAVAESGRYCLPRRCLVIRHGTRERAGDNEEHRDEVMAVSTTPVQSEKAGRDVQARRPGTERSVVRKRGDKHAARLHISGYQWSSCPPLHDFAAAKFFREAERERTGGTGGEAPPFRLGRAGSGAGVGRAQGRKMLCENRAARTMRISGIEDQGRINA